jgi:isopentenyl diphosphate isomerase/L-lactate dehydrogenase-like FMN-dependent dehydrogenase
MHIKWIIKEHKFPLRKLFAFELFVVGVRRERDRAISAGSFCDGVSAKRERKFKVARVGMFLKY